MAVSDHPQTFRYRAHGINFVSDVRLSRVRPRRAENWPQSADVRVCKDKELKPDASEEVVHIDSHDDLIRIRSPFGRVDIERDTVRLFPLQRVTHRALFEYYAVYVLAVLLHQRDHLTVHASAVAVDGQGIAFVGPSGMGKSTTASLFYKRGHRLLSDDLIACRPSSTDASPHIDPGFPWMKLGEHSLGEVLGRGGDDLERSVPNSSKRMVPTHERQSDAPVPLRRVYVLGYHDDSRDTREVQVRRVTTRKACLILLSNAFVQTFLEEAGADPEHLNRCAALARRVPVSMLGRPQSMDVLPSIYDAVLDDLRATRFSENSKNDSQ